MLGAFKWMRNSANEAKRMWLETGKLQGLITTVLMDSKADGKDLFRELRRQRGILLLTTLPQGERYQSRTPTYGQSAQAEKTPAPLPTTALYGGAHARLDQRHF
jgi:hypothetical protein